MKTLILFILLSLCPFSQAQEADPAAREALTYTNYADGSELFLEFKALAVGEESPFAVHLTDLADFSAISQGKVTVTLSGGGQPEERVEAGPSQNPGIFRPVVKPSHAGERQLIVSIESPRVHSTHMLGPVQVYPDLKSAPVAKEEAKAPGEIPFLKEQQWQVEFATTLVEPRTLRASLPATGMLRAPVDAETTLSAPSSGIVVFPETMPLVGHNVTRGQLLASIVPRLAERGDMALLAEEARKTQLRHDLAHREQERSQKMLNIGVIAEHQYHETETAHQLAHAELEAAEKRLNQYRQPANATGAGIPVKAPIAGVIAQSFVSIKSKSARSA